MKFLYLAFRRPLLVVAVVIVALFSGCRLSSPVPEASKPSAHPTIVFMTDFGTANDAVAICKAVILGIQPGVRIMDITHQVTPFSIEEGARFLAGVTPYYPSGTIFLVVVDPGVGTPRKAIVARSKKDQFFVLPDNGLIGPVAARDGIDSVREIANPAWMIGDKVSSTFHGRDIFSPAAAHLAAGDDWTQVGPELTAKDLVPLKHTAAVILQKGIDGQVIALDDPFGNLITNISREDFEKLGYSFNAKIAIQIGGRPFVAPYEKTFNSVPLGQPLLYIDSRGRVALALNQGDFSRAHNIVPPVPIFIPRAKPS
jgi:S-adenosylmethionine hydrolase